jgi:hypothetical protein
MVLLHHEILARPLQMGCVREGVHTMGNNYASHGFSDNRNPMERQQIEPMSYYPCVYRAKSLETPHPADLLFPVNNINDSLSRNQPLFQSAIRKYQCWNAVDS